MTRALFILLALAIISSTARAQDLPPPRNPAGDASKAAAVPALVPPQNEPPLPPQNAQQQPPAGPAVGAQVAKKNPGQPLNVFAALRQAEKERKQARIDRMNQFKAARAADQQKLYQDWHDRYLADTPVRVEYYRALTAAYQSQPAVSYFTTPYYYGAGPAVILPPVYAPLVYAPVYYCRPLASGTFFYSGW
jgi:hypothetical protein